MHIYQSNFSTPTLICVKHTHERCWNVIYLCGWNGQCSSCDRFSDADFSRHWKISAIQYCFSLYMVLCQNSSFLYEICDNKLKRISCEYFSADKYVHIFLLNSLLICVYTLYQFKKIFLIYFSSYLNVFIIYI